MNSRSLQLDEFIAEYPFWGDWEVSYTDGTHLEKDEYVKLGDITIDTSKQTAQGYPILPFTFRPVPGQHIKCHFSKLSGDTNQSEQAKRIICSELADSMVRTGLLRPDFFMMDNQHSEMEFQRVMRRLSEHGYLILVVDTSALRRAATSFLHKTLSNVLIWTVVPVFVMTEVQQKVNKLNNIWRKMNQGTQPHAGKCSVLKKRPQVSCISRELNHIRQWRPVEMLTTFSEHLDQSNGNSRVDRLIIESLKTLKRERGLYHGVYLLTGDKDMASLAALENQASLHINVPSLPSEISSIRYNPYNSRLVLTPIHYLLWDLTQVFSTIRLKKKEHTYKLFYYSQARGGFFARDVLEIQEC